MDNQDMTDPLAASFDVVARQDAQQADLATLRSDVDEVKGRLEKVSLAASRAPIGQGTMGGSRAGSPEMKIFVNGFLRHGRESELKSLSIGSPADGGYTVPREIDTEIQRQLLKLSPIRGIAHVVQVGTAGYRKLVSLGTVSSGWVGETDARPDTATSKFAEIAPVFGELYANPAASQAMLDDSMFDVETWLATEIAREFARAEGAAFVNGTGANVPQGFLAAPTSTAIDGTRAFGSLQYLATGNATGLDPTAPDAKLIDLVHAVKPGHRQGAVWVMNSTTLASIRKIKTAMGEFLWQASLVDGLPDKLLGYPVIESADMPDIGAGAFPIAFGNFQNGYLIAERNATSILRDPYTNKPFVRFYATRRIGGQVLDSEAIKLIKIST